MYVLPNGTLAGMDEHPGNYGATGGYDDGMGGAAGYYGTMDEPYGLSGIFGSIKKAAGKVGKAVVKGVGKGVQVAAKLAPVAVAFIPGVGIPAAAAITAGAKGLSSLTRGKNIRDVAKDTIVGGAEGAAAGTLNRFAFKGQGYKGAGRLLGFGKKKASADSSEAEAQARSDLAQAGKKLGFGKRLSLPEGGMPAVDLPTMRPGSDSTLRKNKRESRFSDIANALLGRGKTVAEQTADAVIASTATSAGGIPAAGGGGSGFATGAGGSSPGVDEPNVQEAGMLSGNMVPLLLAGGALLFLTQGGKRARR